MPTIPSYQYTWSPTSSTAPSNTLASRQNFPTSFSAQTQHSYIANSVPPLTSQHFPETHMSRPLGSANQHISNTSQSLYNQQQSYVVVTVTTGNQINNCIQSNSGVKQPQSSASSQTTTQSYTASNNTPTMAQMDMANFHTNANTAQNHFTANALPVTTTHVNKSTSSVNQQVIPQKNETINQHTYIPM